MTSQTIFAHLFGQNFKITVEPVVEVGKAFIQADAQAAAKAQPRRPQVGDFWETADGSKVYVEKRWLLSRELNVSMVFQAPGAEHPRVYVASANGEFCMHRPGPHPLHLKRLIGR